MRKRVAIVYDFDKTLSNKDMQEYGLIEELGYSNPIDFWNEVTSFSKQNKMDSILAYLYMLLKKSNSVNRPIKRENFTTLGNNIKYFKGVESWFKRINEIGDKLNLDVEHYIISSGMYEIIEGSKIFDNFKKVYACRYYYDENGVAKWPSLVVNYTTKTQYIFRINKQILDENDDNGLNEYVSLDERPIPFKRMIYVGDGLTDVPCMKLVKEYGGKSIVVFDEKVKTAIKLVDDNRANYMCKADYSKNGPMEDLVKKIFKHISVNNELEDLKYVKK